MCSCVALEDGALSFISQERSLIVGSLPCWREGEPKRVKEREREGRRRRRKAALSAWVNELGPIFVHICTPDLAPSSVPVLISSPLMMS
jgi:hypothetical protein